LVLLATAHFLFWYGVHFFGTEELVPVMRYETWDFINFGDPEGRIAVNRELANAPGKQLVFVRYAPNHRFREWVHNAANIDRAQVVWARDLGDTENQKLRAYYGDRHPWLLEPDAEPPKLTTYPAMPAQ